MNKSSEINELSKALVKANSKVSNPKKNATNPHFKNEYATLDSVIESYKKAYLENGISVLENPVTDDGKIGVSITLLHESGQYITHDPFMLPPGRDNAQGYGSSITYARRYALSAVMNIAADDDDDGNAASEKQEDKKASPKQLDYIDSLIKKKETKDHTWVTLYAGLKKRMGTDAEMENWTPQQASQAIKILNGQEKQGA